MARQPALGHAVGVRTPPSPQADQEVWPGSSCRRDQRYAHALPSVEPAPGHGVGSLQPGEGPGPLVRPERGQRLAGRAAAAHGQRRAATVACVVRRGSGDTGCPLSSARRGRRRPAPAARGRGPRAGPPHGPWPTLPPPGASASRAWRSVGALAAVPARWPGPSGPRTSPRPGGATGGTGGAGGGPLSRRALRSSCGPIGGWLPPGGGGASSGWAGPPAGASTAAAPSVPRCRRVGAARVERARREAHQTRGLAVAAPPYAPAPARAARRWRAVAVATWWRRRGGGVAAATMPASTLLAVSEARAPQRRQRRATRRRLVRTWRRGGLTIVGARLRQAPRPLGTVRPESWPHVPAVAATQGLAEPEAPARVAAYNTYPSKAPRSPSLRPSIPA